MMLYDTEDTEYIVSRIYIYIYICIFYSNLSKLNLILHSNEISRCNIKNNWRMEFFSYAYHVTCIYRSRRLFSYLYSFGFASLFISLLQYLFYRKKICVSIVLYYNIHYTYTLIQYAFDKTKSKLFNYHILFIIFYLLK